MRKVVLALLTAAATASLFVTLHASQITGAIFTTISDGTEVNANQYAAKEDVYLNGGPGINAPVGAAGLPDGTYVFQVTDPSGKNLLSTDPARCREVAVSGGVFTAYLPMAGCVSHLTGSNLTDGGITVQLMPFLDTPNNGGVYKAWVTPVDDYACSLAVVDCGFTAGQNVHGFVPSFSKTDNFKVKSSVIKEIDTRFRNGNGDLLDGFGITWLDTLGASNAKYSYFDLAVNVNHEAHVEAIESGTHQIVIANQAGCTVGSVYSNGVYLGEGPTTVSVKISGANQNLTWFIDVYCN